MQAFVHRSQSVTENSQKVEPVGPVRGICGIRHSAFCGILWRLAVCLRCLRPASAWLNWLNWHLMAAGQPLQWSLGHCCACRSCTSERQNKSRRCSGIGMESRNNFLHVLLRYLRSHHAFLGRFYLESSWLLIVHELHEAGCGKYKVIRGYSATAISLSRDSCHISHISTDPQEILEPLAFGLLPTLVGWMPGPGGEGPMFCTNTKNLRRYRKTERAPALWTQALSWYIHVEFTQCHRANIWGWFRPPNMLTWGWFIRVYHLPYSS